MRLGILTAAWKRPAITGLVLQYYAALAIPGVELVRVAAVSPGGETPQVDGWTYVEAPNDPLSDKWNAGMQRMKGEAPDAVVITGSDDLLSVGYLKEAAVQAAEGDAVLCHFDSLHCYEVSSGRCFKAKPTRMGAGRVLSQRLLDVLEWRPWLAGLNKGLDFSMDQRILEARPYGLRTVRIRERSGGAGADAFACVDLKSEENIWSFDHVAAAMNPAFVDGEAVLWQHFPGVAHEILALRQ